MKKLKNEKTENIQEEQSIISKNFKTFGIMSLIFALFYAICFYNAGVGISVLIFAIGNSFFILIWIKELKINRKPETWFYLGSTILLALSIFLSVNQIMRGFSKVGMVILLFCYMLYQLHDDSNWGFSKYISVIINVICKTIMKLHLPIKDLINCSKGKEHEKTKNIIIGIIIAIPVVVVVLALLSKADIIFAKFFDINKLLNTREPIKFILLVIAIYFVIYAFMNAVVQKSIVPIEKENEKSDALIAITFTGILSVIYFAFSGIQIFALFLRKMQLPIGYSYAEYAREGFFQLLTICIINILVILFCLKKFENTKGLRITLTWISICTYIIIASSAFRMIMYIEEYKLSFLRILAFWELIVISFLLIGVMIRIYIQKFPAFRYSMVVITLCYLVLAFMKPDFIIAKYNLNQIVEEQKKTDTNIYYFQDMSYIYSLSGDIMPALRDFVEDRDYAVFNEKNVSDIKNDLHLYFVEIQKDDSAIRDFNLAQYFAKMDAEICEGIIGW